MRAPPAPRVGNARATMATAIVRGIQPRRAWYGPVARAISRPVSPVAATWGTTGVPMAPKETPAACPMSATVTACTGGNPAATRKGAASATDAPNPAAPSMKSAKNQATRRARIRGSGAKEASAPRRTSALPVRS